MRIEGGGQVFIHDHPRTVRLPETDSHAHPSDMFLAVWPCTAAVEEIVAEGHVIPRGDVQVVDLESRWPRTEGKTGFPMLPVCRCSSELQRGNRIERHDVRRVMGHDAIDVLGTGCPRPLVESRADLSFVICLGASRCHLSLLSLVAPCEGTCWIWEGVPAAPRN